MRVSRLLRVESWRDALRELVLIVLGVLVALWVSDWNQGRVDRAREHTALQQLLRTTRENERRVRLAFTQDSLALEAIRRLAASLPASGSGSVRPDSLAVWRERAFKFAALSPLTGTYTALAGSGDLNLLRNDSLRAEVATYSGELGGDVQEMNGWFEAFSRNVEFVIHTLPLEDLRPLYRGGPSSGRVTPGGDLERALIGQYVVLHARMDILTRLLESTTTLRRALEVELKTSAA